MLTVAVSPSMSTFMPLRRPLDTAQWAALSALPSRASTRLAVRAALAAWSTAHAASSSCQTNRATRNSHQTMPISSVEAWPRSSLMQPAQHQFQFPSSP